MIEIALKMLFGERAKYAILVSGICFATILMTQGLSFFFGILGFSYATAKNIRAPIWVVDPLVQSVDENQPLRDTDVNRVRSVEGVAWAAPLYIGGTQAKLLDGGATYQVALVGLHAETLAGAPEKLIAGNILDLRLPQSVIVDMAFVERIQEERGKELKLGDMLEMNDRRAVIVGIAEVAGGMSGSFVFTTWDRAKEYAPGQRKMLTHILAAAEPGWSEDEVTRAITKQTGLKAVSEARLKEMTSEEMMKNSPLPYFIGLLVGVGFVIGIGISGQTFYAFVLENTRHLGALKAMGASDFKLAQMIVVQAAIVGFVGFGVGVGVMSFFFSLLPEGRAPLVLFWQIPLIVFVAVTLICMAAALLCVWRVSRIEPGIVFRT